MSCVDIYTFHLLHSFTLLNYRSFSLIIIILLLLFPFVQRSLNLLHFFSFSEEFLLGSSNCLLSLTSSSRLSPFDTL